MRKVAIAAIVVGVLMNVAGIVVLVMDVLDAVGEASDSTTGGADLGMVWPMVLLGGGFFVLFAGVLSLALARMSGSGRVLSAGVFNQSIPPSSG